MTPPSHINTSEEFIQWLATKDARAMRWSRELLETLDAKEDYRQLCADLDKAIEDSGIELKDGHTYQDGLNAIVDRYQHCRNEFSEWHDHDLASEQYAEETSRIMKKSSSDDDFRYRIRAALRRTGALGPDDTDQYAYGLLCALVGVTTDMTA